MLLHLITPDAWKDAQTAGSYAPPSLAADGFLHLCTPEQLEGVLERHFPEAGELLLLQIAPERLTAAVRWEDLYGHGTFPHLYGPLNLDAVAGVQPL